MRPQITLAMLAALSLVGCGAANDSVPTEPALATPSKGGPNVTTIPYVIRFTGDVASTDITAQLNPADPLKMAEVDLRGTTQLMHLPSSITVLQGTGCTHAKPAVPNTWGPYGGVDPDASDWQGRFWLDRPTGKAIRLYFGLYQTMKSTNTAGSPGDPAGLEFVVGSGVETKTKDSAGRTHSRVLFTNQRAFTTGPGLSFDSLDRCVSFEVTATPQ